MKSLFLSIFLVIALTACRQKTAHAPAVISGDYEKGEALLGVKNDSAFYYFNKSVAGSKDSLETAMAYSGMAIIQSDAGDYFGSQESLLLSLKYLDEKSEEDYYCLLSDYNELGNTSIKLKNYAASISYFEQALKYIKEDGFKLIALNNKAVAHQKNGEYAQSIAIYESILKQQPKDRKEYARILSNLARARWQQDPGYAAAPILMEALGLRMAEKDNWGLNASYAHLADYYAGSRPDSALAYAKKMYAVAQELNSADDRLEALQKLIRLSAPADSKKYFSRYETLSDSVQSARNAAKNQFAVVRYGAEKAKADNLKLQKENAEKQVQVIKHRNGLYIMAVIFVAVVIVGIIYYRKRQQKLKMEAEAAIRESELKTSKKVHDEIANGLYSLMAELEHGGEVEKEPLLDKIELLYEQTRDISYEHSGSPVEASEAITKLLTHFGSEETKVVVVGNNEALWSRVSPALRKEIEIILQELMVNMKKHSRAGNVLLRFELRDGGLEIRYADDGVGFASNHQPGNGLANTENRILEMKGQIIFGEAGVGGADGLHTERLNSGRGLKIKIHIPIE